MSEYFVDAGTISSFPNVITAAVTSYIINEDKREKYTVRLNKAMIQEYKFEFYLLFFQNMKGISY
jgi:hypothetical protein